jgi:hypothetical protein
MPRSTGRNVRDRGSEVKLAVDVERIPAAFDCTGLGGEALPGFPGQIVAGNHMEFVVEFVD